MTIDNILTCIILLLAETWKVWLAEGIVSSALVLHQRLIFHPSGISLLSIALISLDILSLKGLILLSLLIFLFQLFVSSEYKFFMKNKIIKH